MEITPYIIDCTLRDGEQAPGVAFTTDQKLEIARLLDQLGVDELEAGTPAIGPGEREAIRLIAGAGFSMRTSCWCRARTDDLLQAAALGTQAVNISLPVSDIQIETLGKTRTWVKEQLKTILGMARSYFPHVTMGAQDASRSQADFLHEFIFLAEDFGADRIRITDTVGILEPTETTALFRRLHRLFPGSSFEFHGHNDLGMATANTLAALREGVSCISATVNGIGERAGNAALEELIAILNVKYGVKRFNSPAIGFLCREVSRFSGCEIHKGKPLVGANAFRHESGIHTSAIRKNPLSYQFLNPADFGVGPISFTQGKHASKKRPCLFPKH